MSNPSQRGRGPGGGRARGGPPRGQRRHQGPPQRYEDWTTEQHRGILPQSGPLAVTSRREANGRVANMNEFYYGWPYDQGRTHESHAARAQGEANEYKRRDQVHQSGAQTYTSDQVDANGNPEYPSLPPPPNQGVSCGGGPSSRDRRGGGGQGGGGGGISA